MANFVQLVVINGADIKSANTFEAPHNVTVSTETVSAAGNSLTLVLESHSVTTVLLDIA